MNKQKMVQKWEKEIMFPILENTLSQLKTELQCHIEQILKTVCMEIEKLFYQAAEQQKEQKISYITFHIMRQDILEEIYQYHLFLYDENWYLKKGTEIGTLNSSFIYDYYNLFWKEVLLQSNTYRSVFSMPELEIFTMRQLNVFHYYFVEVLRYAMNQITESDGFYKLKKAEHFEIQCGAYYEPCDKLYQQDTEIDYGKWRRQFLKQESKKFYFADLKGISAQNVDFRYADVRKSDLQSINLKNSNLQGARFQKSNLKHSNLEQTILNYACFDNANLEGACFDYAITELDNILFLLKVYSAYCYTSFQDCCLKNASFQGAILKYADFRGAELSNVNFNNAILEKCIFSKEQFNQIVLTEEQKKQITII